MAADASRTTAVPAASPDAALAPAPGAEQPCGPHRRRGVTLEKAIYQAVLDLLRVFGYGGVTMERVAACAHTGKAALYRRWPHKDDLIVDAIVHMMPSGDELPDHGNVRDDLLELLRRMAALANSPAGCAFQNLLTEIERNDAFARLFKERVKLPHRRLWSEVLRRAADRGELRPEADGQLVAEVGPALLVQRCLTEGLPIPDEFVVSVLDNVIMPLLTAPREPPARSSGPPGPRPAR
jgi:AcrR family transcriptional regulator